MSNFKYTFKNNKLCKGKVVSVLVDDNNDYILKDNKYRVSVNMRKDVLYYSVLVCILGKYTCLSRMVNNLEQDDRRRVIYKNRNSLDNRKCNLFIGPNYSSIKVFQEEILRRVGENVKNNIVGECDFVLTYSGEKCKCRMDKEYFWLIEEHVCSVSGVYPYLYIHITIYIKGVVSRYILHRVVSGLFSSDSFVDHIDHDTFNNCKSNLRECTKSQNNRNKRIVFLSSVSGFKGVHYSVYVGKWRARIKFNGKQVHLVYSDNLLECVYAFDIAAFILDKEFYTLNLPTHNYDSEEFDDVRNMVMSKLRYKKLLKEEPCYG